MKDPLHGNTRVSYLIGLSFFSSTDHNRIIMDKERHERYQQKQEYDRVF